MLAPAGTAPDVTRLLSAESGKVLSRPEIQQRVIALGMEPLSSTPEGLAAFLKQQLAKWQQAVALAGIKAN